MYTLHTCANRLILSPFFHRVEWRVHIRDENHHQRFFWGEKKNLAFFFFSCKFLAINFRFSRFFSWLGARLDLQFGGLFREINIIILIYKGAACVYACVGEFNP